MSLTVDGESPAFAIRFALLPETTSRSVSFTDILIEPKTTTAFLSVSSTICPTTLCPRITTESLIFNSLLPLFFSSTLGITLRANSLISRRACAVVDLSALLSLMTRTVFSIVAFAVSIICRASCLACRIISFFSASSSARRASY